MIRCFTGMPGSGKTYALVATAHKALKEGRPVFSNIAIKGTYKITFQDLIDYKFPHGAVILIDEAGRGFNARKWKELPDEIFDLFTLHRHLGLDMYIAAQNFGYIDSQLRKVIELTYWCKNHFWLPFHVYEGYYDLEKLGAMKEPDMKMWIRKSRKIRSRYHHQSMSKVFTTKEEIGCDPWYPNDWKYKTRFQALIQSFRIKHKRKKFKKKYQNKLLNEINDGFSA